MKRQDKSSRILKKTLQSFRLILLDYLHNRSHHYRDYKLRNLKIRFAESVKAYRDLCFTGTPETRRINLLIQAVSDMIHWAGSEYTSLKPLCFIPIQEAFAARIRERLHAINRAFFHIPSSNGNYVHELQSRTERLAFTFLDLNFPTNEETDAIRILFQNIFKRCAAYTPENATLATFEDTKVNILRNKANALKTFIRSLGPPSLLPSRAYWELLQAKIDARNWISELKSLKKIKVEECERIQAMFQDVIKEVNRLKRGMDRSAPSDSDEA